MKNSIPQLTSRLLAPFEPGDWDATARAFADADGVALEQHWLAQRQSNFRDCDVRAGFTENALWIYAQLEDDDIFSEATEFNQLLCELGDCFEIFLRPAQDEVYYEFHVSPENQVLQLRWPDAQTINNTGDDLSPFLMQPRRLQSHTKIDRDARNWRVLAGLTWEMLGAHPNQTGTPWKFSFGRYDYARNRENPVLSSSSPHQQPNFHRQYEWGQLQFERTRAELCL